MGRPEALGHLAQVGNAVHSQVQCDARTPWMRLAQVAGIRLREVALTPFASGHMINFEWLKHEAGANQIFPASADLNDAAGRIVVTSYVVKRPDGNWSLMLINHDLNAAHPVHLVIEDAKHASHPLVGSVALVQYCNNPADNKNITMAATADSMYTLPAGSITILRGKLR